MSAVLSSQRTQTVRKGTVDVIRCGIAEDIYCLEMSAVAGVQPARDMRPLKQRVASDPVGTCQHAEQDCPIFDLAELLGLPNEEPQAAHYLVLIDHPVQRYGLRVSSVSRVIRLPEDYVLPLPKPLAHTGKFFRGIVDFTRNRKVSVEAVVSKHLPGISEPKAAPSNRRRSQHQMQMLLNPETLLPGMRDSSIPPISDEFLQRRYACVPTSARWGNARQMLLFPAGVIADRQLLVGLSMAQIVEISEPLTMITIPGTHPNIWGFVQWRNCPVPVINLAASLSYEPNYDEVRHFLIAREHRSGSLLAFPVTGRVQSVRLPIEHRPSALPDPSWRPFVLGAFDLEERLLILPRLDAIGGLMNC